MGTRAEAPADGIKRPAARTRVGSLLLSWDFAVGVPAGLVVALLPTISASAAQATQTVLLGVTASSAALAAIVLTSVSVLVGLITPAFGRLLDRTSGGLKGILRPYKRIVLIGAVGAGLSLVAALSWPLVTTFWLLRFAAAGLSFSLLFWTLCGCVQLISLTATSLDQARRADQIEERLDALSRRRTS